MRDPNESIDLPTENSQIEDREASFQWRFVQWISIIGFLSCDTLVEPIDYAAHDDRCCRVLLFLVNTTKDNSLIKLATGTRATWMRFSTEMIVRRDYRSACPLQSLPVSPSRSSFAIGWDFRTIDEPWKTMVRLNWLLLLQKLPVQMAPVNTRHFSQSASRFTRGRDYRPHPRFDERSRREVRSPLSKESRSDLSSDWSKATRQFSRWRSTTRWESAHIFQNVGDEETRTRSSREWRWSRWTTEKWNRSREEVSFNSEESNPTDETDTRQISQCQGRFPDEEGHSSVLVWSEHFETLEASDRQMRSSDSRIDLVQSQVGNSLSTDEMVTGNVSSRTQQESKPTADIEPIRTSRVVTDEVRREDWSRKGEGRSFLGSSRRSEISNGRGRKRWSRMTRPALIHLSHRLAF